MKVGLPQAAAPKIVERPAPEVSDPAPEVEAPVFDVSVVSVYGAEVDKANNILVIVDTSLLSELHVRTDGGVIRLDSDGEMFDVTISKKPIEIYNASVYPLGADKIRFVLEVLEIQPELPLNK